MDLTDEDRIKEVKENMNVLGSVSTSSDGVFVKPEPVDADVLADAKNQTLQTVIGDPKKN